MARRAREALSSPEASSIHALDRQPRSTVRVGLSLRSQTSPLKERMMMYYGPGMGGGIALMILEMWCSGGC